MRLDMLSEAIALATRAHAGQLDKAGAPYIGHPQRVARSVAAAGGSETAQVVAYLHDVVEDTAWTFDELRSAGFSDEVVTAVDALTRHEDESYVEFVVRAGSNPIARLVKLADLADNLDPTRIKNPRSRDLERIKRYRSAWMALAGSEFPQGAPFPLAHAASTQTMLETLPGSGRVPGDQPTAVPDATVERPSNSQAPVRQPLRLQLLPGHLEQDPKAVAAFVEAIRADGRAMDEAAKSAVGDGPSNAAAPPDKAHEFKVVLSTSERGRNERTQVTARIRPDGDLEVEYYTAGDEVLRDTGDSDYEHYTTVSWLKLPALAHFLRKDLGRSLKDQNPYLAPAELFELLSAMFGDHATPSSDFEQWLRAKKIPYETFTY